MFDLKLKQRGRDGDAKLTLLSSGTGSSSTIGSFPDADTVNEEQDDDDTSSTGHNTSYESRLYSSLSITTGSSWRLGPRIGRYAGTFVWKAFLDVLIPIEPA